MPKNHQVPNPGLDPSVFRRRKKASTSSRSQDCLRGKVWLEGLLHTGKVEEVLSQVLTT